MGHIRKALCFTLVILSLFVNTAVSQGTPGDGDCQVDLGADPNTFTCTNTVTIPCSQVNDGRNDCGDNSDEGYLNDCGQREVGGVLTYQYKCTVEDAVDYAIPYCTVFPYDGNIDCPDRSDEQKYLGDDCMGTDEDPDDPIGCAYFMPESYCNSSSQCDCMSGRIAVDRNSDCKIRERGDECDTELDCKDAYYGLFCNDSSLCDCDVGFYVDSNDDTVCIGTMLYENCTRDRECSNPVPNAECDDDLEICVCNTLYIANHTSNYSCPTRVLGDPCSFNAQCRTGMDYAECSNDVCVCKDGAYPNADETNCVKRLVGEACASNSECALVRYGECNNNNECDCNRDRYLVDHENSNCALGIGDLFCESTGNCTDQIDNTYCADDNVCMCEYGYYAESHKKCKKRTLGSQNCRNNTDCSNAVDNSVCKSDGSCQCASGYGPDPDTKKSCVSEDQLQCQDFACRFPWAVALLVIGLLAIAAVVVILLIKKPWKKPGEKSEGGTVKPHTVAPVSNGGPVDPESAKPLWTLRPKSGIPAMYGNDVRMQEAKDPETDAFYNGGLTSVETPDDARVLSGDRRVRFESGAAPSTPGNIDLEMPEPVSVPSPIGEADASGSVDAEGAEEEDGGKKKKKGKKGKKEKKEKKKKKGKNKNNNAATNESGEMTQEDEDFLNSSPAFDKPVKNFSELQREASVRPLTAERMSALLDGVHVEAEQVERLRKLDREKSELSLAEKLAKRQYKRRVAETPVLEEL